jgi:hypothetical protein
VAGKNVGGSKPQRVGLAFTWRGIMFDGWTDDFHDIEPSVGKGYPCGDTGGADQHVQARKMSVRCSCQDFNDARAIPIFAREISVTR